jgi:hypothetical protein
MKEQRPGIFQSYREAFTYLLILGCASSFACLLYYVLYRIIRWIFFT